MADQEVLASFGVEIDEAGVSRLQAVLEENRKLAEDLAASFTKAVCKGISSRLENALSTTGYKKLVLAGGVAANSHIRKTAEEVAKKCGAEIFLPPLKLCGDNGAMIGAQAYYNYKAGILADESLNAHATSPFSFQSK